MSDYSVVNLVIRDPMTQERRARVVALALEGFTVEEACVANGRQYIIMLWRCGGLQEVKYGRSLEACYDKLECLKQ
jgi:hypothetical protein